MTFEPRWDLSSICSVFVPQCSAFTPMGYLFWVCTLRILSCNCKLLVFLFYHYCILFCNVIVYHYFLVYDYDNDYSLPVWWSGLDSVPNWANVTVVQSDNCWMLNAEIILDCRDGIKMHNSTGSKKAESRPGHKKSCLKSLDSLQFKVRSNNEVLRWFCTCPIDIIYFGESPKTRDGSMP